MDSIFVLGEGDRSAFFQHMLQSVGATYVCLWSSYLPQPTNCLWFLDGIYQDKNNQQPSSSYGSFARRLFNVYSESVNYVDNGRIPGIAFKNNLPYMELKLHDVQRLVSSEVQLQFYQEAGIKSVVCMGCASGEIELGMSNEPQVHLEMDMINMFRIDFSHRTADQSLPSSSSSSLMSLSFDSTEYSPLIFNIPTTSFVQNPPKEAVIENTLKSVPILAPNTSTSIGPHQEAIQALSQIRNIQFPTIESEDAAMTKAILAVLSSSSSSTSSSQLNAPNLPSSITPLSLRATAFQNYQTALTSVAATNRKQNMFRRSVLFFRNLNLRRRQDLQINENRPTTTQLHHVISERKRREKLNESFQLLRSLLPLGSKKDKASVLSNTTEYLSSLKSQVAELSKRNQILEDRVLNKIRECSEEVEGCYSGEEMVNVEISASTSESRMLDLRVRVGGECIILDLIIRILELFKQQSWNVSFISLESNSSRMLESASSLLFRLKIEGDEFDECGFQEALRRVVDELSHYISDVRLRFHPCGLVVSNSGNANVGWTAQSSID